MLLKRLQEQIGLQFLQQTGIEMGSIIIELTKNHPVENIEFMQIDSIISTVYRITNQTKILALNATIEAVKALETRAKDLELSPTK